MTGTSDHDGLSVLSIPIQCPEFATMKLINMSPQQPIQLVSFGSLVLLMAAMTTVLVAQERTTPPPDDLFLFPPNTPARQIRGAILAERLDRPELGQRYLQNLIDSQPSAEVLVALRREFGIGQFLKLSAIDQFQPTSRELLKIINEASKQETPTSESLRALVNQLGESNAATQEAALQILSAGDAAVEPLLTVDTSTKSGELAQQLLERYSRQFRFGLLRALPSADDTGKIRIIRLLRWSADPKLSSDLLPYRFNDAVPLAAAANETSNKLLGDIPQPQTPEAAVEALTSEALQLLKFSAQRFPSESDRREQHAFRNRRQDHGESKPPFGTRSLKRATELMAYAATILPNNVEVNAAQLIVESAEQAWPPTWPHNIEVATAPAGNETKIGPGEIEAAEIAVRSDNPAAILAGLRRTNFAAALLKERPDLMRKGLFSHDCRVRLLTASAASEFTPQNTQVRSTILNTAAGSKKAEAVVIDSRRGASATVAAVVATAKYEVAAANSGQAGFESATNQLQCELILIHSNCLRWPLSVTVTNLRTDYRTKNTPIIIYGSKRDEERTETTRRRFPGITWLPEPISEFTFEDAKRLAGVAEPLLTPGERLKMIEFARRKQETLH